MSFSVFPIDFYFFGSKCSCVLSWCSCRSLWLLVVSFLPASVLGHERLLVVWPRAMSWALGASVWVSRCHLGRSPLPDKGDIIQGPPNMNPALRRGHLSSPPPLMDANILAAPVGSDSSLCSLRVAGLWAYLLLAVGFHLVLLSRTPLCSRYIKNSLFLSAAMFSLFIFSHFYLLEIRRERFLCQSAILKWKSPGTGTHVEPEVELNQKSTYQWRYKMCPVAFIFGFHPEGNLGMTEK